MCTVTWLQTTDGFELRMNRDELRTRGVALPPATYERNGVRYVAPRDIDGGGTWIAANETGLVVCLLNGPPLPGGGAGARSRGLLVETLADAQSAMDVRMRLAEVPPTDYSPFTILVVEPGDGACIARWNGATLTFDTGSRQSMMLTSSSVDLASVVTSRTAVFREYLQAARGRVAVSLEQFHRGHDPERSHRSVCMHRADASTVSFTRVTVCRDAVLVHYEDGPACGGLAFDPVAIARRPASSASRRPAEEVR